MPFLPSEQAVCDYRIRFTLNNCTENDPPISVYNSDALLNDQLEMQMNLFLNDSVYVDLCEDALYLPSFLIDQFSLFKPSDSIPLVAAQPSFQSDLENLIRFLIDHVSEELSEQLRGLLELDSVEGFGGGENLDEFGRRILSFPIELIPKSNKFSLVIDYNYNVNKSTNKLFSLPSSMSASWYRKKIQNIINSKEAAKKNKNSTIKSETGSTTSSSLNESQIRNYRFIFTFDLIYNIKINILVKFYFSIYLKFEVILLN